MKRIRYMRWALCCLLLTAGAVPHAHGGMALTLRGGTLGGELGLAKTIASRLSVRTGINYFKFGLEGETESDDPIAYDLDLTMFSVSFLFDYHPVRWFRLTAGVLFNNNQLEGTTQAVNDYIIDNQIYTPEEIGDLTARIEPSLTVSPYLGIGFGSPLIEKGKISFFVDFGMLYQGSPDVTLKADEAAVIYPTTEQEKDVEENMENLQWYPVISLGFSFQL